MWREESQKLLVLITLAVAAAKGSSLTYCQAGLSKTSLAKHKPRSDSSSAWALSRNHFLEADDTYPRISLPSKGRRASVSPEQRLRHKDLTS